MKMMLKDDYTELLKHALEASNYTSLKDNRVRCDLCPNYCNISNGSRGTCRNRFNSNGKLYTIAYGNPCATNIDPIEKKPLYHFLPETDVFSLATTGCNLSCKNCQNWTISQNNQEGSINYYLFPADVVNTCINANIKAIAFTYTEPTTYYEYMLETAKLANAKGIKTVVVSNGYINKAPLEELCKYIDGAAINLKSFKDSIYRELSKGKLQPVLDTLKTYKDNGIWLEIINLVIPTWTDDMAMIKEMCDWLVENGFAETPLHFSRFTPQYKMSNLPFTPVSVLEKALEIAGTAGLKYVYIGNVYGHKAENTFCPNCAKKVISRKGYVISEKHIINGNCQYCNNSIAGIWN